MKTRWKEIFKKTPVPEWLQDFDDDPIAAVDAALKGKYYFGSLNVAEPANLLIEWALGIGEQFDFVRRLDEALAEWIERNWGKGVDPEDKETNPLLAATWIGLSQIVANVEARQKAPRVLRKYFAERRTFLGPLSIGPSRDPLGLYLNAIARHQEDDSLAEVWWDYCNLAPDIPWYHGLYGITGLRGLPPRSEREDGAFSERVAKGLALLGHALHRQSREKRISLAQAHDEFSNVAHLTLAAYPFPERWQECWKEEVAAGTAHAEVKKWMIELLPELAEPAPPPQAALAPEPLTKIKTILDQLRNPNGCAFKPIIEVTGINGVGKTTFLKKLWHECRRRKNFRSAYIDLGQFSGNTNALIYDIVRQIDWRLSRFETMAADARLNDLTPVFWDYLRAILTPRRPHHFWALIFDAVEKSAEPTRDWLMSVIAEISKEERIILALAHDIPLNLSERPQLQNRVCPIRLAELNQNLTPQLPDFDWQAILGKAFRGDDAGEITRLTPLAIPRRFTLNSMAQLFENFAPAHKRHSPLEYAYTIKELWPDRGYVRYNAITQEYAVIPLLRSALSANLQTRNREEFNRINDFLAEFYGRALEKADDTTQADFFLEKIYHLVQCGTAAATLLSEFKAFVARLQRSKHQTAKRQLLQGFRRKFRLDEELGRLLDAAAIKKINALFT